MKDILNLKPEKIIETIDFLEKRINDRFPESGLKNICGKFLQIAQQSKINIEWISKPNIYLRIISYLVVALGIGGLIFSISYVDFKIENTTLNNFVSLSELKLNR